MGRFVVTTEGSEAMRIDSSGRLLVGTSTSIPSSGTAGVGGGSNPALQVVHPAGNMVPAGISLSRFQANNPYGAVFTIQKSRNDTIGGHAVVVSGDDLGFIAFDGSNGTAFNTAATIGAAVDGTPGANDMPGRLVFSTTADGAASPTERMRITSDGKFGFNTTNPGAFDSGANNFVVLGNTSGTGNSGITIASGNDSYGNIYFGDGTGTASYRGFIAYNHNGNTLRFGTDGTERMRIDSSGNLNLTGSTDQRIRLNTSGGGGNDSVNIRGDGNNLKLNAATGTGNHIFEIGGTERMRIDSSGRVGIGTSSPTTTVDVNDSQAFLQLKSTGGTNAAGIQLVPGGQSQAFYIYNNGSRNLIFEDHATERMRIDSSGRLLVGTSSALTGTNSANGILTIKGYPGTPSSAAIFNLARGLNSASIANGNTLGRIVFADQQAGEYALIEGTCDGTPGVGDYPGRLVFSTTADGASSPTERVKILNSGAMLVPYIYATTSASAANVIVGSDGNLFRSTSSGKYKTQVEDLQDSYADALLNCRPVWYRSTCELDDATYGYWGFIAEEVAEIDPRLIHWKKTEITYDEEGKTVETACEPEAEGVQYDRFVPHLLNLIKRQQTAIETLEQRLSDAGIA